MGCLSLMPRSLRTVKCVTAVGDESGNLVGIDPVRGQPPFVQADHAGEITACRMPADKDAIRGSAISGDIAKGPRDRGGGIFDVSGGLHLRTEAVTSRDDGSVRKLYESEGMRYRPPYDMMPPKMTIQQAAEALARIPALHQPGEKFTYGFSTDLLGRLIEVWSGKPLDEFMRQAIFRPLEMVDTGFSVPPEKRGRFISCHSRKDGKLVIADKAKDSPFNEGFEFLSGGGGLVSTIQDYANFCQMMVDGGEFKGRCLLKQETIKLMFTDQLNGVAGDFRFGLGFAIGEVAIGSGDSQRKATQYSWGGYASTDFRIVPEEKLFQIMMSQRVPSSSSLANKLMRIVYQGVR